jgi:predicted small metal-binding protein
MTKVLECGKVVPGCDFVAHGDSEDELIVKVAEHARIAHEVDHLSEPLKARIRAAIKDDQPSEASVRRD